MKVLDQTEDTLMIQLDSGHVVRVLDCARRHPEHLVEVWDAAGEPSVQVRLREGYVGVVRKSDAPSHPGQAAAALAAIAASPHDEVTFSSQLATPGDPEEAR